MYQSGAFVQGPPKPVECCPDGIERAPHGQIASDAPEWDYFRFADHPPGTMLPDATGNYRLAPTSKNYALNRPPRAGVCSPFRIAHIENKGRLPRGVTQDFAKQASPQRRFSQRLFMVDHFR